MESFVRVSLSAQPVFHDLINLLAIQRLVSQQVVGEGSECCPQIVLLEPVIKLNRNLFQIFESLSLNGMKWRRCIPCFTPIGSPFGD